MCMIGIAISILFTEEKIKLLRLYLIYHFVLIKKNYYFLSSVPKNPLTEQGVSMYIDIG